VPASAAPILVTGSHRSGSTWVGRILASAPSTVYVHEPFHREAPGTGDARFDCWFPYVCAENEEPYRAIIQDVLAHTDRPVIKDPLAVFSAPWLADRFRTQNVVLIRHPAGFAASLKDKGWTHPFGDFLRQPLLMAHHLEPFAGEIMRVSRQPPDIVDQAALLWRIIYTVVAQFRRDFPGWTYLRHEDLQRDPPAGFRSLFEHLGLSYGMQTERAIDAARTREVVHWRDRLTEAELERVRARVGEIARCFYADEDW
jgi:hypothetical protein